jgi:hypothetical protein
VGLLMWGAVSGERISLPFTIAAGPRQCSCSWGPSPVGFMTIFYGLRFETTQLTAESSLML